MSAGKEMMMAERPLGGGSDGPSIGNYKGVMLCNRPFAGTAVTAKANQTAASQTDAPFRAGIQKEAIGLNPCKKLRYAHAQKKKNSALITHKKWLRDLSRAKEDLQKEHLRAIEDAAKRRQQLVENARVMRAAVLEAIRPQNSESKDEVPETELDKQIEVLVEEVNRKNDEESKEPSTEQEEKVNYSTSQKKKLQSASKPAWAYTESKYDEAKESKEEEEVDDLLSFAENLDFEQYVADYEIRAALEKVRDRISELSRAKGASNQEGKSDDSQEGEEAEEIKTLKLTEKALLEHEKRYAQDKADAAAAGDDSKSIASALSETKSLRSVHSHRSLKAIINKLKDMPKLNTVPESKPVEFHEPRIVQINEDGGMRLNKKNDPSQLPYMHRNPAV